MAIRARYGLQGVEDVDATLTLTMPIKEWRKIADALEPASGSTPWPRWEVASKINAMIRHAMKEFSEHVESN